MDPSALAALPPIAGDRDELLETRLELLLAIPLEPFTEHLEDLGLRAAGDEDHEAEAELLLVDLVQVGELGQDRRLGIAALLLSRPGREPRSADCGMGVQRLDLVVVVEPGDHIRRLRERVPALGEELDEARLALEELRELVPGQLPR